MSLPDGRKGGPVLFGELKRTVWEPMNEPRTTRQLKKVLAVASGGGHWMQSMRLLPPLDGCHVVLVTVARSYHRLVPENKFYAIRDACVLETSDD
jgi:hypothetical protein